MASGAKVTIALALAAFFAVTVLAVEAKGQRPDPDNQPELSTPLEPLRPGVAESQLFAELEAHNQLRKSLLLDYTVLRTYQVVDLKGKVHAEEIGQMEFRAPDEKRFVLTSERGSGVIRRMALNPLISSEIETAAGKQHHDSSITPANYSLDLLGEQRLFEIEIQYFETTDSADQGRLRNGKRYVERCWLCDQCAIHIALRFDPRRGLVVASSLGRAEGLITLATPQATVNGATGRTRALVRSLDINLRISNKRNAAGQRNVRRSEIA